MLQRHDAVDIPDLTMDPLKIFAAVVCLVVVAAAEPAPDQKNFIAEFGKNNYGIAGKVYRKDNGVELLVENFSYAGW